MVEMTDIAGITAKGIDYSVNGRQILSGLSAQCRLGEMTALTGVSGSGKTTLIGILGLLISPTNGIVEIDGISRWTARSRRKFWEQKAAFIYQDYGLIDEEEVAYNVTLRRHLSKEEQGKLASVLTKVGLMGRGKDIVATLSGGEKQRVGIARALYKKATYIFADEPTASLDEGNRKKVYELLRKACADGACVVVSTHDQDLVRRCDAVVRLKKGTKES